MRYKCIRICPKQISQVGREEFGMFHYDALQSSAATHENLHGWAIGYVGGIDQLSFMIKP